MDIYDAKNIDKYLLFVAAVLVMDNAKKRTVIESILA